MNINIQRTLDMTTQAFKAGVNKDKSDTAWGAARQVFAVEWLKDHEDATLLRTPRDGNRADSPLKAGMTKDNVALWNGLLANCEAQFSASDKAVLKRGRMGGDAKWKENLSGEDQARFKSIRGKANSYTSKLAKAVDDELEKRAAIAAGDDPRLVNAVNPRDSINNSIEALRKKIAGANERQLFKASHNVALDLLTKLGTIYK